MSLLVIGLALVGESYRGPRTLDEVPALMPGVPLFPLSSLSPHNRQMQRLLAIPLYLARLQGARSAHAVLLTAPGDGVFVSDWYRQLAPSQQWKLVNLEEDAGRTRLVFLRQREALQVTIDRSGDLQTGVLICYLQGLTAAQLTQLTPNETPVAVSSPTFTVPFGPAKKVTPPPVVATPALPQTPTPPSAPPRILPPDTPQTPDVTPSPPALPTTPPSEAQPAPVLPPPAPPAQVTSPPAAPVAPPVTTHHHAKTRRHTSPYTTEKPSLEKAEKTGHAAP